MKMQGVLGANRSVRKAEFGAFGKTGLLQSGGSVDEEWLNKLQGAKGVKIFREIGDQDPAAAPLLTLIGTLAARVDWSVVPSDKQEQGALDVAEFIDSCRTDMSSTWGEFVSEAITGALQYGWAFYELVYKQRGGPLQTDGSKRSAYSDGRIGIRKIELRAQETLDHWEFDDDGGIAALVQSIDGEEYTIPITKAVLFRNRPRKNNPEGTSILRAAYVPWYYGKRIRELEAVGIENDATGMPVQEIPAELFDSTSDAYDSSLISTLEKKVTQIRRGEREGLVVPSELDAEGKPTGWKTKLLASGGSRQFDMSGVISRYRTEVAVAILYGGFLYSGTGAYGSFSLHDSQTALFADALDAVLNSFAETYTRFVINPLCVLNGFPPRTWPKLSHGDVRKPDLASLASLLQGMFTSGLLTPTPEVERRLLDIAGLPHDE